MKQIKKPDTAIFFGTYKEMIYNSTPEQCKAIMTAFCQYAFDDIDPTVPSDNTIAVSLYCFELSWVVLC